MLDPNDLKTALPFPSTGRISVCHGVSTVSAMLQLPAPDNRSADALAALPAVVWVTVGLLAKHNIVLQIKLRRNTSPSKRDLGTGQWHVYHASVGALTLIDEDSENVVASSGALASKST